MYDSNSELHVRLLNEEKEQADPVHRRITTGK